MPAASIRRRSPLVLVLLLAAFSTIAFAQAEKGSAVSPPAFEPHTGQAGKDVVWVPTPQVLVDKMLDLAKVTKNDYVMDLGSGDGRTVITAAKRGATAVGIEYNPDMVELSRRNAEKEGVTGKASFVKADLFETDFSKATVITMFLLPAINLKLRPKILALKPGTRVVSNSFDMDEWQPDEKVRLTPDQGCDASWCTALFWIVPAHAAGTYKVPQGDITLKQTFQMLSGTLTAGGKTFALEGKVRGEEISFSAGGKTYRGKMKGNNLELR
jgi:SAM-dependent methyltransferase